ncbi:uncharacterized protein LOC110845404 isoform X1 [Folsomia candida]|uniref:uncharacterized protein LOC110845404 isoform X1 n=1 Tax=Folsomia candida TaxID=158441 RepID=UPI00160556C0|nr:uncharacterized protein LOC110845404 isoform X1 [Folsomia candida]
MLDIILRNKSICSPETIFAMKNWFPALLKYFKLHSVKSKTSFEYSRLKFRIYVKIIFLRSLNRKEIRISKPTPHGHGGGTVVFVTQARHRYLNDLVERNEGGTPDIVGSIRLGLVFQLQKLSGIGSIVQKEGEFTRQVIKAWRKIPEIIILGPTDAPRLPIISFLIYNKRMDCYLHHNFVTTLLNDLFGIQSRSGCMCAGPYGQLLLGIDDKLAKVYEQMLSVPIRNSNGDAAYGVVFKPGFTRVSLPYHASQQEISYLIDAVMLIATQGWKFLPFYEMNSATGTFKFASNLHQHNTLNHRVSLKTFGSERVASSDKNIDLAPDFEMALSYAKHLLDSVEQVLVHSDITISNEAFPQDWYPFRWFLLPSEALFLIRHGGKIPKYSKNPNKLPFIPKTNYKTNKYNWILGSIPNSVRQKKHFEGTRKELAFLSTLKSQRSLK